MIRQILCGAVALLAGSAFVAAAGNEDLVAAAKKLKEANSYSWKTTTEMANSQFTPPPVEGKTADGLTMITMEGRNGNTIEVVLKGDKGAIKTQDGWQSFEEANQNQQGQGGRGRFMIRRFENFKAPAEQALSAAEKIKEVNKEGDAYTADLSEEVAKSMLTFGGRRRGQNNQNANNGPQVSNAKGTAKFWVKDGALTKYELHVTGTVDFNGNTRDIDRTVTTDISDVGSTKVNVPEEAQKKLS